MPPSYSSIVDHGSWSRYTPTTLPEGAPPTALFIRRDSDGTDWYDYAKTATNFQPSTLKMTVTNNIVSTVAEDPTLLFPQGATLLEIFGTPLGDQHDAWSQCGYDPATQTFTDPPDPITEVPAIKRLEDRIAALEAKQGGA
jgi:hypothetical protein